MAGEDPSMLQGVRARRERLESAADDLERAITRASGVPDTWCDALRAALEEVGRALVAHVDTVEAPDGLFDEIVSTRPRLLHAIERLRLDHQQMREQITDLDAFLAADDFSIDAAREAALVLLLEISRHRHRGADLLWEFYDVDIGGGD